MKCKKTALPIAACFAMYLTGCATAEQAMQERVSSIPESQRAYIIGTYAVGCGARGQKCDMPFNAISLYYQNKSDANIASRLTVSEGGMFGGNTVFDFVDAMNKQKGIYFCHSVPAGEYFLYSYSYWNYDGGGNGYQLRKEDQFDVPFQATAGKITYVGDIKLTYETGKNLLGIRAYGPGVVELSPGSASSAQMALSKCPESARNLPLLIKPFSGQVGDHEAIVIKGAN